MALEIIDDLGGNGGDLFTVRAGVTISGGMWGVATSGSWSAAVAASGTIAGYTASSVTLTSVIASGVTAPLGLALTDVASGTNNYVALLRKGTVVLPANAAVTVGNLVAASNAGAAGAKIAEAVVGVIASGGAVGRAYTTAGSGEGAVVQLML